VSGLPAKALHLSGRTLAELAIADLEAIRRDGARQAPCRQEPADREAEAAFARDEDWTG